MAIGASNPLANPSAQLSGKSLIQAAQALANAQVDPAITALAQQMAQNNSQTSGAVNQVGGYFGQLGDLAKQGLAAEQGIQSGLNDQLTNLTGQEQQQIQGIGTNAQQSMQSYIPKGDYGSAGMQALTAEIARQQGLAAQEEGTARQFGATQGANYSGLSASGLTTTGLRGQEDLTKIAQAGAARNIPLAQKMAQLDQTKAADYATALGKLRQQEITNSISEAGLGIKQAAVNATVQNNIRNNQTSSANNQRTTSTSAANNQRTTSTSAANNVRTTSTSAANNAANNAIKQEQLNAQQVGTPAWYRVQQAAAKTGGGSGAKPLSTNENNSWFTKLSAVQTAIKTWQQQGIKDSKGNVLEPHPTAAQMRQVLGGKYDPTMVQAAFELMTYGYVSAKTAENMRSMGLRGGTYNNAPIRVSHYTQPAPAPAPTVGNSKPGPLTSPFQKIANAF